MEKVKSLCESKKFYEIVFIVVVIVSFVAWLCGIFISGSDSSQFNLFFSRCSDFFADTTNVVGYSSGRDVYHNMMYTGLGEKAYPPLTYVMMYLFSRLVNMEPYYDANYFLNMYQEPQFLIIYLIYATFAIVMAYELIRTCKKGNNVIKIFTAAAFCVSAPMIFSYERANTIILTMFCVMFYMFYYDSEKKVMREIALLCLAIATAFKMTPALLGILLLYNKQWKEAVRAVIYGVIIGIGPFLFFEGGFSNITQMFANMSTNVASYVSTEGCTLTAALVSFGVEPTSAFVTAMKYLTYLICLILFVSAVLYRNKWEMLMAISIILIIAPSHSGQYCILYIFPAIVAFLNAQKHHVSDLIILFSILLIMYDVQSTVGDLFLNYHLAIVLITLVLLVRGIQRIIYCVRNRSIEYQTWNS